MPVEPVPTPSAPASAGPYSPAVRAGDWLALAGQVGIDPASGKLAEGGVADQTRQAMANVAAVLGDCGASLGDGGRRGSERRGDQHLSMLVGTAASSRDGHPARQWAPRGKDDGQACAIRTMLPEGSRNPASIP